MGPLEFAHGTLGTCWDSWIPEFHGLHGPIDPRCAIGRPSWYCNSNDFDKSASVAGQRGVAFRTRLRERRMSESADEAAGLRDVAGD